MGVGGIRVINEESFSALLTLHQAHRPPAEIRFAVEGQGEVAGREHFKVGKGRSNVVGEQDWHRRPPLYPNPRHHIELLKLPPAK